VASDGDGEGEDHLEDAEKDRCPTSGSDCRAIRERGSKVWSFNPGRPPTTDSRILREKVLACEGGLLGLNDNPILRRRLPGERRNRLKSKT